MGSRVKENGDGEAVGAEVGERVAETEGAMEKRKRKRRHENGEGFLSFMAVLGE